MSQSAGEMRAGWVGAYVWVRVHLPSLLSRVINAAKQMAPAQHVQAAVPRVRAVDGNHARNQVRSNPFGIAVPIPVVLFVPPEHRGSQGERRFESATRSGQLLHPAQRRGRPHLVPLPGVSAMLPFVDEGLLILHH